MIKATTRERIMFFGALFVVGLYVLDRVIFTPLSRAAAALRVEQAQLEAQLLGELRTLRRRRELAPRYRKWVATTLLSDPSQAESQLLNSVRNWSRSAGVEITSLQPERPSQKGILREIRFQASTTGSYEGLVRFLLSFQEAEIPVRVHRADLRLARGGRSDRMVLDLRFSTLWRAEPSEAGARQDREEGS